MTQLMNKNLSQNSISMNNLSRLDLTKEDYLNNNVEYSFIIDAFED